MIQIVAAVLAVLLGAAAVIRRNRGLASWCFLIGMLLLAVERSMDYQVLRADDESAFLGWLDGTLLIKSIIPAVWLCFSLIYARGNRREFLLRWKWVLIVGLILPPLLILGVFGEAWVYPAKGDMSAIGFLFPGILWVLVLLLVTLGILVNLEKTFRAAVGLNRWRIKYLFLGAGLIFGVKLYTLSQALLFSGYHPSIATVNAVALIIGCSLIGIGHSRSGFGNLDLYPSRTILQGSLTVVLAGAYFLVVGVLAQIVGMLGGAHSLPAQAFLVLLGLVGGSVLLLSERFRTWLQRFVSRHFRRPEHDFRKLWTEFTRRTSSVFHPPELGKQASEVVSENFHVLGVSILTLAAEGDGLEWLHSTSEGASPTAPVSLDAAALEDLAGREGPFDLERDAAEWTGGLREACQRKFDHGGDRVVVPLAAAERLIGVMVLADRVNGVPYSHEELDLLGCIGDQLGAALLNCTLTDEVLQAKEMEAFQTLSTFFVHDLKNAANSLNLMLQNLPVHFDDPEFREDAIRAVGRTVDRINKMVLNLSSLRRELQLKTVVCQLDELMEETLDELESEMGESCRLERSIEPATSVQADPAALRSVIVNLVVNARESIEGEGLVRVSTKVEKDSVLVTVEDNGCGMSEEYLKAQLFRPFHSTKTKGLGIGMFQCKKILEAHQGSIRVKSELGRGTRFFLRLPLVRQIESISKAS